MSEVYMTKEHLNFTVTFLSYMNSYLNSDEIKAKVVLTKDDEVIGKIRWEDYEEAYVYEPNQSYEPYEPTDRGE